MPTDIDTYYYKKIKREYISDNTIALIFNSDLIIGKDGSVLKDKHNIISKVKLHMSGISKCEHGTELVDDCMGCIKAANARQYKMIKELKEENKELQSDLSDFRPGGSCNCIESNTEGECPNCRAGEEVEDG